MKKAADGKVFSRESRSVCRRDILATVGLGATMVLSPSAASRSFRASPSRAGRFQGVKEGPVTAFKGICYGRARRFERAVAYTDQDRVVDATRFAPIAPQLANRDKAQAEDCLFLNVWTPESDNRARRPVMVYLHGGAYNNGTVTDPVTHGGTLAERADAVVVTVNQRLNAFGYLYLDPLSSDFSGTGNNGQFDLILALQWVQDNIAAFGGDAARVMVFGQSGGGAKIATLMAMPAASGLFHSAATMSGQQVTASGPGNALRRTKALLDALNIRESDAGKLRELDSQGLLDGMAKARDPILGGSLYFGPVMDMQDLPRHPFWPDAAPQSLHIPMILGNTINETRAFLNPRGPLLEDIDFDNLAARIAANIRIDLPPGEVVAAYRARYPDWSPERLFYAITTDGRSWPGQWIEAEARAKAGAGDTWVYRLDRQSPIDPLRGAAHTDDLPYVFGTLDAPGSFSGTDAGARQVRDHMIKIFGGMAHDGVPGLPADQWRRYALSERMTLLVDKELRQAEDPRGWERRLWSRAPYIQPGI